MHRTLELLLVELLDGVATAHGRAKKRHLNRIVSMVAFLLGYSEPSAFH
jgi:hypothetical protein